MSLAKLFPYNTSTIPPPPGVTVNFDNPVSRGYLLIVVGGVLLGPTLLFVAVRLYVKVFIVRKINWGDVLCIIATLGGIAYYTDMILGVVKGPMGKHLWDVRLVDATDGTLIITASLVTAIVLSPTLLAAKLAIFTLYYEVFHPFKWMRICLYIGMAVTIPFYVGSWISFIYFAVPKPGETWETHGLSRDTDRAQNYYLPYRIIGLVIDVYLLVLPLKAVIDLHLPMKKKFGVLVVFMTGALATVSSSLSVYYGTRQIANTDITWNSVNTMITAMGEIDVAVIVSCMPAMSKLLHRHKPGLKGLFSFRSSNFRSKTYGSTGYLETKSNSSQPQGNGDVESGPPSSLKEYREVADGSQILFELNHMKSVSTYIRSESASRQPHDDGIHLTREVWQR